MRLHPEPGRQIDLEEALASMTAERDHYKRELGIIRDRDQESRVARSLGLTGKLSAMLMTLHARAGRLVTKDHLMDAMYGGRDEPELKIIDVFVCKLRARMPAGSIETVWGRGYLLTDTGVAAVQKALEVFQ